LIICFYAVFVYHGNSNKQSPRSSTITTAIRYNQCDFIPSTDEFIRTYKSHVLLERKPDVTRVEPTIERMRNLLEIIRSKENRYQSLLETFDVFNMENPEISLKPYVYGSNIDEIRILYDRYIKLLEDKKSIQVTETFIDYLGKISSYLSDGLRNQRTNIVNEKFLFV
jgi:hypothetical protein